MFDQLQVGQTELSSLPPRIRKSVPIKADNSVGDWLNQSQHQVARPNPSIVDVVRALPNNLSFDGTGNWLTFKQRFTRYDRACMWSPDQCLDSRCWSLTGKAADFQAMLLEREPTLTFSRLMNQLENRFGHLELPESAQARFQVAMQMQGESLEEWAYRVLTMAMVDFRDLPEYYSNQQAVIRFCQGLLDKDAGQHVCMSKPHTVDHAMDDVRWFQHVHQAVQGKSNRRDKDKRNREYEGPKCVCGSGICSHRCLG